MKRLLWAIAALFLLTAPLSVAAAGGTATVTAAKGVAPGETITFTVTIRDADPVRAVMITPIYDSDAFELMGGVFLRSGVVSDFGEKDGVIAWSSPADINGGLVTFTLKAKSTVEMGKSFTIGCEYTVQDADDQRRIGQAVSCTVNILGEHTPTEEHIYDNACDTTCNVCGDSRTTSHVYGDDWIGDDTAHWKTCVNCQAQGEKGNHSPAASSSLCAVCQQPLPSNQEHIHNYAADWTFDAGGHWHACSCGDVMDLSSHSWSEPIETEGVLRAICTICGTCQNEPIPTPTTTRTTQSEEPSPTQPKPPLDVWVMLSVGLVLLTGSAVTVWLIRKKNT